MQEWQKSAFAGVIAGLAAAGAFLTLHAIVIVPIWRSVPQGMISAAIAGAIITIAFHLAGQSPSPIGGLLLGLLLWGALLPPSIIVSLLHNVVPEKLEITAGVTATLLYGAAIAARARRRWTAVLSGALAALGILVISGGPLTHVTRRPLLMFAGLLPVDLLFGLCMVAALRIMRSLDTRHAEFRSTPDQHTHPTS